MSKKRGTGLEIQDLPRQAVKPEELRLEEAEEVKGGIIAILIGIKGPTAPPNEEGLRG